MAERKIKVIVVDGLTADDVLKLKAGGFFDGATVPLPQGATGQEATLRIPVRDDSKVAESLTPAVMHIKPAEEMSVHERSAAANAVLNNMLQQVADAPVEKKTKSKAKPTEAEVDAFIAGRQGELNAVVAAAAPNIGRIESNAPPMQNLSIEARDPAPADAQTEPKGNGKKMPAKHAIKGATYVVKAFGAAWYATADGIDKAGPAFVLHGKSEPNRIYVQEGTIIEEVDTAGADQDALDTDTAVDMSPETLASFTKLRDLIDYAVKCGIPAEGMSEFCEQMKDDVPLLQRISNIADRVQRTLEVMGLVA
jgi:hypothetical protein